MPEQPTSSLQDRISALKALRADIGTVLSKTAFMAAPPMPGGGQAPPMDPAMMQGGGAPPMDPSMMPPGGMPMDPAMMPPGGMPMDPAMMDPAAAGGAPPQAGGGPLPPEMVEELFAVIEELAAGYEKNEQIVQQLGGQMEEVLAKVEELESALAQQAAAVPPGM